MAIKTATPFSGELPAIPVFKNGLVHYCHNQKELDKWTKPVEEGGPGYSQDYIPQKYPRLMSHPEKPDVKVGDEAEEKKYAKLGYNFEHWDNTQAKAKAGDGDGAAAGSFDPKAQSRIDALEKQNADLAKKLDTLLAKLGG